jgi:N-acetylglucosaminyl-diphospho-decaprenol L-rhamnosyltransferase
MVDIVIVNWNSGAYLKTCIDSVLTVSNEKIVNRVILIDNNSTDGSIESIRLNNTIELISNKKNLGFAKACNQGFRLCTAPFVLLLNPDTILFENTLNDCINLMQSNSSIDILGCRLLDDNGNITASCSRFPTPLHIFFDAAGLSKIAPSIFTPATVMTDWRHDKSSYVNQVMGAFMFMQKKIFENIGYFDERFFVYYEEVDFCRRLSLSGGKVYYDKDITTVHSGEGTTKDVKAFRLFLSLRSRLQYAKKHFSVFGYMVVWVSTFIVEPVTRVFFLTVTGRFKEIKETLKGFSWLVKKQTIVS